jgi:hypothetical protein
MAIALTLVAPLGGALAQQAPPPGAASGAAATAGTQRSPAAGVPTTPAASPQAPAAGTTGAAPAGPAQAGAAQGGAGTPTVLGRSYPPPVQPPVVQRQEPNVYVGVVSPRDNANSRLGNGTSRSSGVSSGMGGGAADGDFGQ